MLLVYISTIYHTMKVLFIVGDEYEYMNCYTRFIEL